VVSLTDRALDLGLGLLDAAGLADDRGSEQAAVVPLIDRALRMCSAVMSSPKNLRFQISDSSSPQLPNGRVIKLGEPGGRLAQQLKVMQVSACAGR
jgi:hypothetical protein